MYDSSNASTLDQCLILVQKFLWWTVGYSVAPKLGLGCKHHEPPLSSPWSRNANPPFAFCTAPLLGPREEAGHRKISEKLQCFWLNKRFQPRFSWLPGADGFIWSFSDPRFLFSPCHCTIFRPWEHIIIILWRAVNNLYGDLQKGDTNSAQFLPSSFSISEFS